MKLTINAPFRKVHHGLEVSVSEALEYVCDCEENMAEGELERVRARCDALENVLGNLLRALTDNGRLRADQITDIFDYNVTAED